MASMMLHGQSPALCTCSAAHTIAAGQLAMPLFHQMLETNIDPNPKVTLTLTPSFTPQQTLTLALSP